MGGCLIGIHCVERRKIAAQRTVCRRSSKPKKALDPRAREEEVVTFLLATSGTGRQPDVLRTLEIQEYLTETRHESPILVLVRETLLPLLRAAYKLGPVRVVVHGVDEVRGTVLQGQVGVARSHLP